MRKKITYAIAGLMAIAGSASADDSTLYKKIVSNFENGKSWEATSLVSKITNQDVLYDTCLTLVKFKNSFTASCSARKLTDNGKRYDVAKALIYSGNPNHGRRVLDGMPMTYRLLGVRHLKKTGNPRNAREEFREVLYEQEGY